MKRILVLRGGALGDFIVTLPALRLLRQRWPSAQIELVGNARAAELGLIASLLNAVHAQAEARWSQLYTSAPLTAEFQTWLDRFDLIVNFWPDPDGELRHHFAHRDDSSFIASDARVTTQPAAAHFCAALRPLGLATADYASRLCFPRTLHAEATRRLAGLENFIALHPGSGSARKNWPPERWAEFASRLRERLLIVTGEAEGQPPHWPNTETICQAHNWPLPVLGAALAQCRQFIGHDSGISHLAAAAGAPCVLLFGPTDPSIWAPPGTRVIKIGDSLATIRVEDVLTALAASPTPPTRDQ